MCGSNVKLLKNYNKATQDTKAQMFLLSNWINDALKLNEQICYILADINENANLMPAEKIIKFANQCNMKTLHSPNKLVNKMDLQKHTHVVKQKSDL